MGISISYVDNQLTVYETDINLNAAPAIDVVGDDGYDCSDPFYLEVDSDCDPNVDEVSDDIDDESVNDDRNVNASSIGNQIQCIVIHNNLGAHMSLIDPDAAHAAKFRKYPYKLPTH
ncbi:hypothetical protein J1N35_040939 [Gossypium stocksii]|uniref:Uncharacterized protein n=1 Tax=Gossypium stocksii TaxID=47602 RepID=A0A9D3UEU1_9ROSI|nr:hypothetical protein J1N35_040939 [Gossypium stocksii]